MSADRRLVAGLVVLAVLGPVAVACGGTSDSDKQEAQEVIRALKSLKPGEFLIEGRRREKYSGPYTFGRGGYVLRFRRIGGSGRLAVALESVRGSRQKPYQRLLDTGLPSGKRDVALSGRLYVHVTSSADGYILRFTPKRRER